MKEVAIVQAVVRSIELRDAILNYSSQQRTLPIYIYIYIYAYTVDSLIALQAYTSDNQSKSVLLSASVGPTHIEG